MPRIPRIGKNKPKPAHISCCIIEAPPEKASRISGKEVFPHEIKNNHSSILASPLESAAIHSRLMSSFVGA